MLVLLGALLATAVAGSLLLLAVAFPYRARELDRAPWLGDVLLRAYLKVTGRPRPPEPDPPPSAWLPRGRYPGRRVDLPDPLERGARH